MPKGSASQGYDERYNVATAVRTIDLLEVLARQDRPAPLGTIMEQLGWTKPAVYRLLRTLESLGALRRVDGTRYVLGPRLIPIGQAGLRSTHLLEVSRPYMVELRRDTGETVVLTVLDDRDVIIIDRVETLERLIPRYHVGERLPAYCTATGQVLLSGMSDEAVRERLRGVKWTPRGPRTLQSLGDLLERLADVRRRGYALNDEELAVGHRSIAAPIRDHHGTVAAALSISAPSVRITARQLAAVATERLIPAVQAISAGLGAQS